MNEDQWKHHYKRWLQKPDLDSELRQHLQQLEDNEEALADSFGQQLAFGTGGMRGQMGPGPNRINLYTIRKATEGLARYLIQTLPATGKASVIIAYDSRHHSALLAIEAAKVLGKHHIHVRLFDQLCPTPLLSFAVRYFQASAGIVITASHNPPQDNGYKVYGPDGGQITLEMAARIMSDIKSVGDELTVQAANEQHLIQAGLLQMLGAEVLEAYLQQLLQLRLPPLPATTPFNQHNPSLSIVFTPLHGAAYQAVMAGLRRAGYQHIAVVPEQAAPDPQFPTVRSPNPEDPEAFRMALDLATQQQADVVMACDPDGDRLGVAVPDTTGAFRILTGNQVGAILLSYLLERHQENGSIPANGIVLKTIVTSELGRVIAQDCGLAVEDTLTGFKFIGEKLEAYQQEKKYHFMFGYEESNGYLHYPLVRDKDAVQAAILMADVAEWCKANSSSVYEYLLSIFARHGYYAETLLSFTCKGPDGAQRIASVMNAFRQQSPSSIAGRQVVQIEDYLSGVRLETTTGSCSPLTLPQANVLKFFLKHDAWYCLRPSGTEPKLKIYVGIKAASMEDSERQLRQLTEAIETQVTVMLA